MKTQIQYGILARRSNGETVFYCESSNGARMSPHSLSLAFLFDTKKQARAKIKTLSLNYAGLTHWSAFQNL